MSEKMFNTRIQHKHDIEANWLKATNFIPKQAELIVYDPDENFSYARTKIGDGVRKINDLPFVGIQVDWNQNDINAADFVKNRTHWEEKTTKEETFMVSKEINFSEGYLEWVDVPMLTVNQKYIVKWNGERYECLAKVDSYGDVYIGNPHLADWDEEPASTEPFLITTFSEDNWTMICCEPGIHTIEILLPAGKIIIHKLDSKYIDLPENLVTIDDIEEVQRLADDAYQLADGKMDSYNPVGAGSFSMNRKADTTIGFYSHAEGKDNTASGKYSHAEGYLTEAIGTCSHAEGVRSVAGGDYSHAEGASKAFGLHSHTENGAETLSTATGAHAEGFSTAGGQQQHTQGRYNIIDSSSIYAHIVGNGASDATRSNIHTLDWEGNAWFAGDVYVSSTSGINKDEGSKKLATEEVVQILLAEYTPITPEDIDEICGQTFFYASEVLL